MADYAIGDLQGCYRTFEALLSKIPFSSSSDRLLFVGDLVNRGPRSLEILRNLSRRGDNAQVVLGNHDLHLIAAAAGVRRTGPRDTLDQVLAAKDKDDLIDWLRHQPLLLDDGRRMMVHAGVLPSWSPQEAKDSAAEIESGLRSDKFDLFLRGLYGKDRNLDRARESLSVLTRIRMVDEERKPFYSYTGARRDAPKTLTPWFEAEAKIFSTHRVVFGHWAALGLLVTKEYVATDSGCVWGNELSAVNLDNDHVYQMPNCD